ncbi:hypothetical protein [Desulfosudis oleivorans]|uniref:hypothetical protein n=1 Tax=Desulfosudis oleivorans TaxID=181663 RepID=UPI00059BB4DC|nr:hypothetical protein [Desulfosudis oleivorans]
MKNFFGTIFQIFGGIALIVFGLWGLGIEIAIVNHVAGFWGVVIGLFFFPVTFAVVPWYALVVMGTWLPLAVTYGGGIVAFGLLGMGGAIKGD